MAYHHGDLPRALVREGRAFLREVGPERLSLRALARRIGVSHTAVYRHFPDKASLLAQIAVAGFADLEAATAAAVASAPDTTAALAAAGLAYVGFARSDPETFRLMFRGTARHAEQDAAGAAAFAVLEALVTDGQAAGVIRDGDPFLLALTLWSTVHGLARIVVDDALPDRPLPDGPALAAMVAATLLVGIGTHPA